MPDFSICPQCNTKYRTAGMPAFKRLRCKKCQGIFVVAEDVGRNVSSPYEAGDLTDRPTDPAEHAIPAAIGDSSALGRANFKGGVTLGDVGRVANPPHNTDDTIEGLPRPIEKKIEAAIKPAATDEKYIVEGEIARGGMGVILKAADRDIRRPVAMKVMLDAKSAKDKARFVEEAQVTGQLEHPNIVPIHELGIDAEGRLFFTMKLVKGHSLKDVLDELRDAELPPAKRKKRAAAAGGPQVSGLKPQAFTLGRLLSAFINICNAMAFAHAKGVVHRDLKPANIMLGDYGEVLVMDWGLAKVVSRPLSVVSSQQPGVGASQELRANSQEPIAGDSRDEQLRHEAGGQLTLDGTIIGTPHYMPPEQADGKIEEIDARSDIYSLGAMLYEILTLMTPCAGKGIFALIKNVSEGNITPPDQRAPKRNIPKELSAITIKALARRKEDRYQRVEDLRRDIELFIEGRAVSAKEDTFAESVVKLVKRNKTASVVAAAAFVLLSLGGAVSAWINYEARSVAETERQAALSQKERAETALTERDRSEAARRQQEKDSVPALLAQARWHIERKAFDAALDSLKIAVGFDRDNAEARMLKAELHLVGADFAAAQQDLREVLRLTPDDADAKQLLTIANQASGKDNPTTAAALADVFGRRKEFRLAETQVRSSEKRLALYRQQIEKTWKGKGECLTMSTDGSLALNMAGMPATDLNPLQGIPIRFLDLSGCPVVDLGPLQGIQLERLSILGTKVKDLRPLSLNKCVESARKLEMPILHRRLNGI